MRAGRDLPPVWNLCKLQRVQTAPAKLPEQRKRFRDSTDVLAAGLLGYARAWHWPDWMMAGLLLHGGHVFTWPEMAGGFVEQ